ncbi:MAG: hypothetical protein IJI68_06495 [Eggerthellaceae bacterium]|nr:hypothetical protein [Eggerthellaceae bacterium]
MQIMTKRIGAIMLAACMLAVLAFGGAMAWAETSQAGNNSLTVQLSGAAYNDQSVTVDITASDVEYDLYQIASGEKDPRFDTWNYTWDITAFASLKDQADVADSASDWQDVADAAAALVEQNSIPADKQGTGGTAIKELNNGLFLVIPHETLSDKYRYTFVPSIVALPTKEPIEGADPEVVKRDGYDVNYPVIGTAVEYGAWKNEATIYLKFEVVPRYGSLIINKNIQSIAGTMANWKKASFHYHIVSTADSPFEYDNWASVTVTGEGDFQGPPIRHIQAGTIVKVTEVYEGADFTAVGSTESDAVTIIADNEDGTMPQNVAQVYFTNTSDKKIIEGSGIQNEFTWQDGDWQLAATPESGQINEPTA